MNYPDFNDFLKEWSLKKDRYWVQHAISALFWSSKITFGVLNLILVMVLFKFRYEFPDIWKMPLVMKYLLPALIFFSFQNAIWSQKINEPLITKSIFFGGGSYYVDYEQAAALQKLINSIENPELYEVYVHGHTDNIGSIEYNQWLSDMRTDMVIIKIKNFGIAPEAIFEKDFGENSPVYDNNTWEGKLMNRRVDIIFKKLEM